MKYVFALAASLVVFSLLLTGCGGDNQDASDTGHNDDGHGEHDHGAHDHEDHEQESSGAMPTIPGGKGFDPVCGMLVALDTSTGKEEYNGVNFDFCSSKCQGNFEKDKMKYAYCPVTKEKIDPSISKEVDGKTIYFCCKDCVKQFNK